MEKNIEVVKGSTFNLPFRVLSTSGLPVDVTNWTFSGRLKYDFAGTTAASFTFATPYAAGGEVIATLTDEATAPLTPGSHFGVQPGAVYSITATDGDKVYSILYGRVRVEPLV